VFLLSPGQPLAKRLPAQYARLLSATLAQVEKVRTQFLSLRQPYPPTVSPSRHRRQLARHSRQILAAKPYRFDGCLPFRSPNGPLFSEPLYLADLVRNPFLVENQALCSLLRGAWFESLSGNRPCYFNRAIGSGNGTAGSPRVRETALGNA
jgi:hypothetical protein